MLVDGDGDNVDVGSSIDWKKEQGKMIRDSGEIVGWAKESMIFPIDSPSACVEGVKLPKDDSVCFGKGNIDACNERASSEGILIFTTEQGSRRNANIAMNGI